MKSFRRKSAEQELKGTGQKVKGVAQEYRRPRNG